MLEKGRATCWVEAGRGLDVAWDNDNTIWFMKLLKHYATIEDIRSTENHNEWETTLPYMPAATQCLVTS